MPDTKLSALPSDTIAGGDSFEFLDVSDTTDGPSGSNKREVVSATVAGVLAANDAAGVRAAIGVSLPAGSSREVQFVNAGALAAATNVSISTAGDLVAAPSSSPATPASGAIGMPTVTVAGRAFPAIIRDNGRVEPVLTAFVPTGNLTFVQATNGTATLGGLNSGAWGGTGTATGQSWANTSRWTRTNFLDYLVTVAATTAVAGGRISQRVYSIGSSANEGGFFMACKFGFPTGVASTTRAFCGMYGTAAAPTDVEPSSLVTMFGFGFDAADTQWQFMHNDASGTATKIALGASYPRPTAGRSNIYHAFLHVPPNGSTVFYEFWEDTSGVAPTKISGSVNTNLPANTAPLAPWMYHSVGGVSSVIGFSLAHLICYALI